MRVVGVNLMDKENNGDMMSAPGNYFSFNGADLVYWDVRKPELFELGGDAPATATILGGGGLLAHDHIQESMSSLTERASLVIGWGVGHNRHTRPFRWFVDLRGKAGLRKRVRGVAQDLGILPRFDLSVWEPDVEPLAQQTQNFALLGIRDHIPGYRWVPCVSCLSPRLDYYRDQKPEHSVVVYDHPMFCGIHVDHWPKMSNLGTQFEETLRFLASGKTVLTSSYHGAYWAALMGRKVVCVPWSTKFLGFKHMPALSYELTDLGRVLRSAPEYPEALRECREANLEFASDVERLTGTRIQPKL